MTDIDIVGPSSQPLQSPKAKETTEEAKGQELPERTDSEETHTQQFEVVTIDPSAGNTSIDPSWVDYLFSPCDYGEFIDLYSYTLGLAAPSPPPASGIAATTTELTPTSQPGSQAEQIDAIKTLDDPVGSQEAEVEDADEGEKTPKKPIVESTLGSESSSKRTGKRGASKKKKHFQGEEGEEKSLEEIVTEAITSPTPPVPSGKPMKLKIKPSSSSKGGKKK